MSGRHSRLRVLLVSAGDEVARAPAGAVARRLAGYAARVDRLVQIAYSPLARDLRPVRVADAFASYPTRSRGRAAFFPDALALGHRLLAGGGFDLVETQDPAATGLVGLVLARSARLPVVVTLHTEFFSTRWLRERPRHLAERLVVEAVVRRADGVRVVSASLSRDVVSLGVPADRVGVAPVPLDDALFGRGVAETPARRAGRAGGRRILFVGRLVDSKDVPLLLRSLQSLPSARLDVVGDGPDRARLEALAGELGLATRVHFAGPLPPAALSERYWACDVLALPTRYEGYGRVLAEAALHGAPAVATAVGGVTDLVAHRQTGLLVPPGDAPAFALALASLLDDPTTARRMGEAAFERAAARFDPGRQADDLVAFWQRIASLGERSARP